MTSTLYSSSYFSLVIADCDIESVNAKISKSNLYANFTQTKTIASLSRPLISKGQIWMSSDGQLVWQTQFPIQSTMVMSGEGVKLYNKNNQLQPASNNVMVKNISGLFLSLLSGNVEELEQKFYQQLTCAQTLWKLELRPKDESLSRMIEHLSLQGSDILEVIAFQEARGDSTTIDLFPLDSNGPVELEKYLEQ